jgi:hypothetical protein
VGSLQLLAAPLILRQPTARDVDIGGGVSSQLGVRQTVRAIAHVRKGERMQNVFGYCLYNEPFSLGFENAYVHVIDS